MGNEIHTDPTVLWLTSWYPDKLSPYNGDFVRRHAEAVSSYMNVSVIHVVRDFSGKVTKDVTTEYYKSGNLEEIIIYYYIPPARVKLYEKYLSIRMYKRLYKQALEKLLSEKKSVSLAHLHVGMKAGLAALWLKEKKNIPFVVTEHWGGFLNEADEKYQDMLIVTRWMWRKVFLKASAISSVSGCLLKAISKIVSISKLTVIPNVVNTEIFYPSHGKISNPSKFIHVSNLSRLKNPKLILTAFQKVKHLHPAAELAIFGSLNNEVIAFAESLGLINAVTFHAEVPQQVLADNMRESVALILYSDYETFGCVVIEANACGIPVIVSDIPVFHETVKEGVNGFFAEPRNSDALAERMLEIIKKRSSFDSDQISNLTALKYSYPVIGKKITDWYQQVLKTN